MQTKTDEVHQQLVTTLKKSGETIREELSGYDCDKIHMVIGIAGEAGELLDAVKKETIYRKAQDRDNIIEELGDLEFFMEGLRQIYGIKREETLIHNLQKLNTRYHEKRFSNEQAQNRADKIQAETKQASS